MDLTSSKGRMILRQVQYRLALARRRRRLVNVAELASRLARKYYRGGKATTELADEIAIRAAKAGLPVYLSRSTDPK